MLVLGQHPGPEGHVAYVPAGGERIGVVGVSPDMPHSVPGPASQPSTRVPLPGHLGPGVIVQNDLPSIPGVPFCGLALVDARVVFPRTIAKSGNTPTETGDGLDRSEGTAFGSQGHGHPCWKSSLQAQCVDPGIHQSGRIPRPTPDAAACGRPHPNCGLSRDAGCSQHSSAGGTLEAVPLVRTARNSGWSADTSAPGPPPQWLYPPSPSPPWPPASPRETPTHPGRSRPAGHRSRSAASRSHPLFFQGLRLWLPQFLWGKPVCQRGQHRRLVFP